MATKNCFRSTLTIPEFYMLLKTRVAVSRKMPVMSASSLWIRFKLILTPPSIKDISPENEPGSWKARSTSLPLGSRR